MNIIIVLFLLVGIPYGYTQYSVAQIENNHPPEGQFKLINNLKMHYDIIGKGPTVVLLHSQPSNQKQFYKLKDILKDNYQVISIDRPGMGYSDPIKEISPKRLQIQAQLIRELLKDLKVKKPIIVGHSYGGAFALSYAIQFEDSVKGLVLVNTASHPWKKGQPWLPFRIISNPIYGKLFSNTFAMIYGKINLDTSANNNFPNSKAPINYIKNTSSELTLRPKTLQSYTYDALNLREALELQKNFYNKLSIPVTIMSGNEDTVTPNSLHSYQLNSEIKQSKLVKYIFLALMGSIILAISSKIRIPFYPVPMTMQTLIVLMIGITFGWKLGLATISLYLFDGMIGLPVFSSKTKKGIGLIYFTGPTMGYLLGFLVTVYISGKFKYDNNLIKTFLKLFFATSFIYLLGLIWLGNLIGWDKPIFQLGAKPVLLAELFKILIAAFCVSHVKKVKN